jgi:hypothetical protein
LTAFTATKLSPRWDVDLLSYRVEMVRVHASWDAAQMVKDEAVRDLASVRGVDEAVSLPELAVEGGRSIAARD